MKKLILFLLLLIPGLSKSQPLFGYNPSQVREEHLDANWHYDKYGDAKDLLVMYYDTESIRTMYFFDYRNVSTGTVILPKNKGILQWFIETYNNRYVIIDNTHWKFYNDGSVFRCSLEQTNDGRYYFDWVIEE